MKKLLLLFFLCFKASLSLQADPYYFQLTSERNSHTYRGLRNTHTLYVLGTIHDEPLESLPQAVRDHIHAQQQKGAFFVGESAIGVRKNQQITPVEVSEWYEGGYLRTPNQIRPLNIFSSAQKQQLYKYIEIVYPELTQNTTPLIKLDDFNEKGLYDLYRLGRRQCGMDAALADLFGTKTMSLSLANRNRRKLTANDLLAPPGEGVTLPTILDEDIAYDTTGHDSYRAPYLQGQLEPCETKASLEDWLVKGRNEEWIPCIMNEWKFNDILVGVGCAHLLGEHSVLELLRKEGFSIKRMRDDGTWVHYADAIGADPPAPIAPPSKQLASQTPHHKAAASKKAQAKTKHKKKLKKAKRTKAHQRRLARLKQQRLKQQRLKKMRLNRIKRAKMRRKNHMR